MRIIIDNRSHLSDIDAVMRVWQHMQEPSQVEGREYLRTAMFTDNVFVSNDRNKCSHRFVVTDYPEK